MTKKSEWVEIDREAKAAEDQKLEDFGIRMTVGSLILGFAVVLAIVVKLNDGA